MRCDVIYHYNIMIQPCKFQSLLGFLMRCDKTPQLFLICHGALVSIPAGFSDALRLNDVPENHSLRKFQSLLGFLMRCDSHCDSYACTEWFQSLLGFLMRCDRLAQAMPDWMMSSFNPCWVF